MSEAQNRQFAFGSNKIDNCACPALTAGMHPENNVRYPGILEAAEWYDEIISDYHGVTGFEGIVDENVAKDAWIEMIEQALERGTFEAQAAIDVAVELSWIDREDYEL